FGFLVGHVVDQMFDLALLFSLRQRIELFVGNRLRRDGRINALAPVAYVLGYPHGCLPPEQVDQATNCFDFSLGLLLTNVGKKYVQIIKNHSPTLTLQERNLWLSPLFFPK